MQQRARGWVMPEADIVSLLRLIDERVSSPKIEARHRDTLIRLRDMLEDDLNRHSHNKSRKGQERQKGDAA